MQSTGSLREALARIHPEDRERVEKLLRHSLESRKPYQTVFRLLRTEGSARWMEMRGEVFCEAGGRPIRVFGTCIDVSEQKRAEARIAFEKHKLETIFRDSPAAMALWHGSDFVFELVNPEYQAIFPGRVLVGKPFLEALPEFGDRPFIPLIRHVFQSGEPFTGREMLAKIIPAVGEAPEERYYDFAFVRVMDTDERPYGVYCHAIDVTERVTARRAHEQSREKLAQSVNKLEKERELRERFVAMLGHDLRSPLTAARITAQMTTRRGQLSPESSRQVQKIIANIDRADTMIRISWMLCGSSGNR